MGPFELLDYEEPHGFEAPVRGEPKRNAFVELHNLIAAAESTLDFGPDDLARIGRCYGVDLTEEFLEDRCFLYARFLDHCLERHTFTEDDRAALAHLACTLALSPDDVRPFHERAFGRAVAHAVANDTVSAEERTFLLRLQLAFALAPGETAATYEAAARERLLRAVARVLCDGALAPEEAAEVELIARRLDVALPPRVATVLEGASAAWRLTHTAMPSTEVGVRLKRGETGHYRAEGRWRRVNEAKLAHYRRKQKDEEDAPATFPKQAFIGPWYEGAFALTSWRLVLTVGRRKKKWSTTVGWEQLAETERFADGLRVGLWSGMGYFLQPAGDVGLLHTVLWRAWRAFANDRAL